MHKKRRHVSWLISYTFGALVLAFAMLTVGKAQAAWPERPIRLIVPFPPGGPTDLLGRLLANELSPRLGQPVVVENRSGAVGNIGLAVGAHAQPDGYTLIVVTGVVLINPSVSKVEYDPIKSFAPIAYLGASPNAIITRPASGIKNFADLIAKAKAAPGKLTYATAGVGSYSQLAVELIRQRTNIKMTNVPFKGAVPALQAALAGTTDIASIPIAGLIGFIRSGKLIALVQTGNKRWVDMPDTPTLREVGISADVETAQMFLAPAGTPEPIIKRLMKETKGILQKPEVRTKMLKAGFMVEYGDADMLRAFMVKQIPMWKEIVDRAGISRR